MRASRFVKVGVAIVVIAVLVSAGVTAGWKIANKRDYDMRHQYPRLDPSVSNPDVHQEIVDFDPLRQDIRKYLTDLNLSHSFYFEYLPNGVNIRDGDDNISQAASLMKTPIIMDLYKLAEQGKINLDSDNTVQPVDINPDASYGNPTSLKAGDTLTLREAAKITLQHSDNTTLNVVKGRILPLLDKDSDSFRSLDVSLTVDENALNQETISISARSYSSILKCLYYACFNTPEHSTQILDFLIDSTEHERLMAGVASNIPVAHKVGSSTVTQSDCGIIYVPSKPYLVCLMFFNLQGDTEKVNPYFEKVSKMIYDYVTSSGEPDK